MRNIFGFIDQAMLLLGPEGAAANPFQTMVRAGMTYGFAVLLVRLGHTRSIGRNNGIDIILSVILGSVLSRAVNGTSPVLNTFAASASLLVFHWLAATVTFHSKLLSRLLKGNPCVLIEDGRMRHDTMRASHISEADLTEALRIQGRLEKITEVDKARLECNGEISVLEKKPNQTAARILEVSVANGVQTIRVQLE